MTSCAAIPARQLEVLLQSESFLLLRNADVIGNIGRGGDIDLLVSDRAAAASTVQQVLGTPLHVRRRTYVTTFVYPWGRIDLLPSIEWKGAVYLSTSQVFGRAVRTGLGASRACAVDEALICWFSSLLWGGFFKMRYKELIVRASLEERDAFEQACVYAVGQAQGSRLAQAARSGCPESATEWTGALRRAVWQTAFQRHPLDTMLRTLAYWQREVALRVRPPAPWLAILGPDGSGKSSVIAALRELPTLRAVGGTTVVHWRPGVLRPQRHAAGPVTDPHGKRARGRVSSAVKLLMLLADWQMGYWGRLAHLRAKGIMLISDRYFDDLIADPLRYRYSGPQWLARVVSRLVPQPDLVILLDVPPEILLRRKQELPLATLKQLRERYLTLAERAHGWYVVDGTRSIKDVAASVEELILRRLSPAAGAPEPFPSREQDAERARPSLDASPYA